MVDNHHPRGRLRSHLTAPRLDKGAGRLGVELLQWFHWDADGGVGSIGATQLSEYPGERYRGCLVRTLIERGQRQRLPEQLAEPRSLPVTHQPLSHSLILARSRLVAARPSQGSDHPKTGPAFTRRDRLPLEDSSDQMQRRRQMWTLENGCAGCLGRR